MHLNLQRWEPEAKYFPFGSFSQYEIEEEGSYLNTFILKTILSDIL